MDTGLQNLQIEDLSSPTHIPPNTSQISPISPIDKLPDEVLVDILSSTVTAFNFHSGGDLMNLMLVCTRWHSTILDSPYFWRGIIVRADVEKTDTWTQRLTKWIERSKSASLDVVADYENEECYSKTNPLSLLFAHHERWRSLRMEGEEINDWILELRNFQQSSLALSAATMRMPMSLPLLRTMELDCMGIGAASYFTVSFQFSLPVLHTLKIGWQQLPPETFQILLSWAPNLRDLHLERISIINTEYSWRSAGLRGGEQLETIVCDERLTESETPGNAHNVDPLTQASLVGGILLHCGKIRKVTILTTELTACPTWIPFEYPDRPFVSVTSLHLVVDFSHPKASPPHTGAIILRCLPNLQHLTYERRENASNDSQPLFAKAEWCTTFLAFSFSFLKQRLPSVIQLVDFPLEFGTLCKILTNKIDPLDAQKFNRSPESAKTYEESVPSSTPEAMCQFDLVRCPVVQRLEEATESRTPVEWKHIDDEELLEWVHRYTPRVSVAISS
jgi:hypothetical protein